MSAALTGRVHGSVIELDAPVPGMDGQRVRVVVERVDEVAVDAETLRDAWNLWLANRPDGALAGDDEPELP